MPDTVDDAARAQSTGRAFSVRVDNDPIDETLDERLFPDRFEGKLMGDNLRHSETGWADLGGRQLDHDPPTAVAPHDCDASVENPPVQAAPARLSRFFRVKRPKPRASRARVEAEPSYEQNYETYYDDEPPTTLAAGSVLTPAPAEELDLALAEELYTGRPPGESAAPQPRRFSIPAWALAGIIGILAIPLLMMTGASSALTGSGTAPAGGLIASIQKWFESPPLPACPAGLVRAPDKKCWPIQRKIEPVTEVGAETPPVALPLEDVATDLAAKKPTMPSVGVSDASAVTRVTPPPASSNTGRSNAGRPKAVAPAGAKADKPSSGKLAIGKSVPTSAAAGPKKLPAANARSASNRSPG